MSAGREAVLFEHRQRGDLWRLEVTSHNGRTFGNWRRWFEKDGEVRPTREGCTIPLERLSELQQALEAYHARAGAGGPPSAS